MAFLYIVRHGRAAASFTDDLDPGLDDLGRQQALEASRTLVGHAPLALRSSPLRRAVETAEPTRTALGQPVVEEVRFAEIPSPGMSLAERGPWLRRVMSGRWSEQSDFLQQWRADLVDCMRSITEDTAIFSHFVAINAAVGAAEGDDRVILFRPDNGSITTIEVNGDNLRVVSRGSEADTRVN